MTAKQENKKKKIKNLKNKITAKLKVKSLCLLAKIILPLIKLSKKI